jgi:hypothetical protein
LQALKRHYEKILLGIFLLGLLGLGVHLLTSLHSTRQGVISGIGRPSVNQAVETMTSEDFRALQLLDNPEVVWQIPRKAGLFSPDDYMLCINPECSHWLPLTAEVCPYCGEEQKIDIGPAPEEDRDEDGIRDVAEEKYAFLDAADPRDADQDYDEDWFTNREEIDSGTAPDDAGSHPPAATLLRLISVAREPFNMLFDNLIINAPDTPPEKWDIVLRVLENGQWKTRFAKLNGDPVAGYRVIEVKRKVEKVFSQEVNADIDRDVSEIVVQGPDGDTVNLVRTQPSYTGRTVRLFLHTDARNSRAGRLYTVAPEEELVIEDALGNAFSYVLNVLNNDEVVLTPSGGSEDEAITVTRRPPRQMNRPRRTLPETRQRTVRPPDSPGPVPSYNNSWGPPPPEIPDYYR